MYFRGFEGLLVYNYSRYSKTKHISGLLNLASFVRTLQMLECAHLVMRQTSILKSSSCHTLYNIPKSIAVTACSILSFTCVKLRGK